MVIRSFFAHQQAQPSRTYAPNKTGQYHHYKYINETRRMCDMESSLWNAFKDFWGWTFTRAKKNTTRKPGVPPCFCNNLTTVDSRFLKVWLDSHEDMISSILDVLKGLRWLWMAYHKPCSPRFVSETSFTLETRCWGKRVSAGNHAILFKKKNKHIFFNRSWSIALLSICVSFWRDYIPDHTMLAVCFLNQRKLAFKPLDLLKTFTQYWWTTSCQPIVDMVTSWCFFETYSSKWVGSASQSFWGESSNVWNHPLQVATPLPLPKTNKSALKSY